MLARRVCAFVAATGMAVSVGAVCAVADEEQVWREGGGLVYPLGRDLSKTEDDGVFQTRGHAPGLLPPYRCRGRHVHAHRDHGPGRVHAFGTPHPLQRQGRAGVLARRSARDRLDRMDREHAHRHATQPTG